jgi:hypothetical protein
MVEIFVYLINNVETCHLYRDQSSNILHEPEPHRTISRNAGRFMFVMILFACMELEQQGTVPEYRFRHIYSKCQRAADEKHEE